MPTALLQKLQGDTLLREATEEIRALHSVFVTWFRGEAPLPTLQSDLQQRMVPTFSHVAPNGHMVTGRDVLISYLTDKYGCYQDRTFSIQVYNVQVLWSTSQQMLCSYEEWQSWDDDDAANGGADGSSGSGGTGSGKQQFGRLSTCLLEKSNKKKLTWVHVHETWMEAEEPVLQTPADRMQLQKDDETVMTGPVPPDDAAKLLSTGSNHHANTQNTNLLHSALRPTADESESSTEASSYLPGLPPSTTARSSGGGASSSRQVVVLVNYKSAGITKQMDAQEFLTQAGVEFSVVDGAVKWTRCRELQLVSLIQDAYPQFFIVSNSSSGETIQYWGGWAEFKACQKRGTLAEDLEELDKAPEIAPSSDLKKVTKKVSIMAVRDEPPTAEEKQFLEASQGILFFEDEEEAPPATKSKPKDGMTLDDLMDLEADASERSAGFVSVGSGKSNASAGNGSQAMLSLNSAADASHKRHVSAKLEQYAKGLTWDGALVGVSIAGFDIGTSQGPIANADWYTTMGDTLEEAAQSEITTRRKIALPEMVFPVAHVAMEGHGIWLSWDAADSLQAWAQAHSNISVQSNEVVQGVGVLQTKDAALWQRKQQKRPDDPSAIFHYDWTYSTPFSVKAEGGEWIELDESGIRMDLLTDQSVPILFFDEIVLFEDDLHDNGQVQLSIKLRIMPTCAYILSRLWVRVDNVIVRVRETRVLVDFFGIKAQIYRDVTWRECNWEDLSAHGLPTSVKAWSIEHKGGETPEWHNLVQQLPEVDLPEGELKHTVLEYGNGSGSTEKMEL